MKITVAPAVMADLETITAATRGLEFSGMGYVERRGNELHVYDFALGHVGSEGFTRLSTEFMLAQLERPDRSKMKAWIHRHPVGDGIPGPHCWSSVDEATIALAPLGGIPEMVGWSISLVRTPHGWVGRLDRHTTGETMHLEVEPNGYDLIQQVRRMKPEASPGTWQHIRKLWCDDPGDDLDTDDDAWDWEDDLEVI